MERSESKRDFKIHLNQRFSTFLVASPFYVFQHKLLNSVNYKHVPMFPEVVLSTYSQTAE